MCDKRTKIGIAHRDSCPTNQPGFEPDPDPAISQCNCDFGERMRKYFNDGDDSVLEELPC